MNTSGNPYGGQVRLTSICQASLQCRTPKSVDTLPIQPATENALANKINRMFQTVSEPFDLLLFLFLSLLAPGWLWSAERNDCL